MINEIIDGLIDIYTGNTLAVWGFAHRTRKRTEMATFKRSYKAFIKW